MKQCKRLAALLLCMVLLATMIPSASAYTVGDNVNVYLDLTALLSLPEHNLLAFPWMATKYCSSAENGNTLTTSGEWIYCCLLYTSGTSEALGQNIGAVSTALANSPGYSCKCRAPTPPPMECA